MSGKRVHFDFATCAALGLWASVGSIATVLTGRAMAGAFDRPIGVIVPVVSTLLALAATVVARSLLRNHGQQDKSTHRPWDGLVSLVPAATIGFATSVNASPTTLAIVSSLLVGGLVWMIVQEGILSPQAASTIDDVPHFRLPSQPTADETPAASPQISLITPGDDHAEEPLHECLTRRSTADGGEEIEAVLLARFDHGQRQTAVHLPIHPVLAQPPLVECEPLDDSPVSTQITAVHTFGVRLEVKRTGDIASTAVVPIGLLITASHRSASAA